MFVKASNTCKRIEICEMDLGHVRYLPEAGLWPPRSSHPLIGPNCRLCRRPHNQVNAALDIRMHPTMIPHYSRFVVEVRQIFILRVGSEIPCGCDQYRTNVEFIKPGERIYESQSPVAATLHPSTSISSSTLDVVEKKQRVPFFLNSMLRSVEASGN